MKTSRLYKENVYLKEADAKVLALSSGKDGVLATFDKTVFFPAGGGQSCDKGHINGFPVKEVYEYGNQIYHVIDGDPDFAPGDTVHQVIDWDRRFDNMQRHCGEHILSGVFHALCGGVNRGFHMGDDYMTIDISLEDDPAYTKITDHILAEAELRTNQIIWNNLPVVSRHFDRKEDAEGLPLRKKLSLESDITIVSVGDINNPSDCVACCGTHPSTSGQVGMVKIYKMEPNKGMYRIYFEAGQRALMKYRKHFDILTALERDLSSGDDDVLHKYEALKERYSDAKDQVYRLTRLVAGKTADEIRGEEAENPSQVIVKDCDLPEPGDLLEVWKALGSEGPMLLILVHRRTHTAMLFSSAEDMHCGKLIKARAGRWGGRGGGSSENGRAVFSSGVDLDGFIDSIRENPAEG